MSVRRAFAILWAGVAVVTACSSESKSSSEKICTPGAYVFCRCQNRSEGTKLCTEEGDAFEKCVCGDDGTELPPLSPTGDAGFEEVDSGPPEKNPDNSIDAKCVGKLAVLASSEEDIYLFAAAYTGKGAWTVAKSQGPALRSSPSGGLVGTSLVAVWRTRYNLIAWTKFQANQTTLSPPVSVGSAVTPDKADFNGGTGSGKVYYVGTDDSLKEGSYSPSSGWDDATTAIGSTVPGKSAPTVAFVGSKTVLALSGTDGSLSTQTKTGSSWSAPAKIAGAQAYEESPAMTPLVGGTEDLIIVYTGSDLILHSTARSGTTWSAPILVDAGATPNGAPSVAPMSKGRALAAWKATNDAPMFSIYDPAKSPKWSPPAPIVANANVKNPPIVGSGRCSGQEVTATYVDEAGNVNLALLVADKWIGPFQVPGMTNMTFAGAGEVP